MRDVSRSADKQFLGYPAGLGWLSFCELWERFSFYGMQALLVLYLSNHLLLPERAAGVAGLQSLQTMLEGLVGPRTPQQLASLIFGIYVGLVYLTPILGGFMADRWVGRKRCVTFGAIMMAVGHCLMAFEAALLPALALLLVGVGAFKGNIAAQVGELFAEADRRRATAYQVFILSVQIAAVIAPIVCGTVGEKVAWHWGFGIAGLGMLLGLVAYLLGARHLPPEPPRRVKVKPNARLTRGDWQRVAVLLLMLPILTLAIVGYGQFGNAFPLWAQRHMDMVIAGFSVPLTWLQAIDGLCRLASMLAAIAFWRWWDARHPEVDELAKISWACLAAAIAPALLMIPATTVDADGTKVSMAWTVAYSLLNALAFATIVPVGMALFARVAPASLRGLMIGVYFLHVFFGSVLVGWLAGLLDEMASHRFWGLHAVLVGAAGIALMLVNRIFHETLSAER